MEQRLSMYEEMSQDPRMRMELAAAEIGTAMTALLWNAFQKSRMAASELAAKMEVTESRLEEIFDMENVNFFTVARFMKALDCELEISVVKDGKIFASAELDKRPVRKPLRSSSSALK